MSLGTFHYVYNGHVYYVYYVYLCLRDIQFVFRDKPPTLMQLAHYALKLNVCSKGTVFLVANKTPLQYIETDWGS